MPDLTALKAANAARWSHMHVHADKIAKFNGVAERLIEPEAKTRYLTVQTGTNVPWAVIAVIHEREASQNWNTHLAQGDPLHEETRHVPKGEPAFKTWEEGAIDALKNCAPFAACWTDWSIGGALCLLEQYNGLGYAKGPKVYRNGVAIASYPPQASPYVWAGTDQYVKGKYVADGEFDPDHVDTQLGCAGLLMAMMALDASIVFRGAQTPAPTMPAPQPVPAPPEGGSGGLWDLVISILKAIFGRK